MYQIKSNFLSAHFTGQMLLNQHQQSTEWKMTGMSNSVKCPSIFTCDH